MDGMASAWFSFVFFDVKKSGNKTWFNLVTNRLMFKDVNFSSDDNTLLSPHRLVMSKGVFYICWLSLYYV